MSCRALCFAVALSLTLSPAAMAGADDHDEVEEGRGPSKRRRAPRRAPKAEAKKGDAASDPPAHEQEPTPAESSKKKAPDATEPSPAKDEDEPAGDDQGKPAKDEPAEGTPAQDEPTEDKPAKGAAEDKPTKRKDAAEGEPAKPDEDAAEEGATKRSKDAAEGDPAKRKPAADKEPAKGEPSQDDRAKDEPAKDEPEPAKPPPPPQKPPTVTLKDLSFVGGEVARAERFIGRAHPDIAQCVHRHGGVASKTGVLSMQFLVRARGRAEGVEVLARRDVSEDAGRCVRRLLKGRWMGSPSQDPVGVTFRLVLTRQHAK